MKCKLFDSIVNNHTHIQTIELHLVTKLHQLHIPFMFSWVCDGSSTISSIKGILVFSSDVLA